MKQENDCMNIVNVLMITIVHICIGMLLEMDSAALQQLLCDQSTLAKAVQKAQAALDN